MAEVQQQSLPIRRCRPRGSAAVETAVVLPLLLLLALGTTDLGRFSHAYIAIATAARNGAQYGSTSLNAAQDSAGIRTAARAEMSSIYGYSSSNPSVTSVMIDESGGRRGDDDDDEDDDDDDDESGPKDASIRVTVTYRFTPLMRYPGIPQSMTLVRTVHMRVMPIEVGDDEDDEDDDDD